MARQGCRNHRFLWQFRCLAVAWLILGFSNQSAHAQVSNAQVSGSQISHANVSDAQGVDLRLELTWASDSPRVWAGDLKVAGSAQAVPAPRRFSEPGNRTPGMLLSGGVHLTPERDCLRFAPPASLHHLRDRSGHFVTRQATRGGISFRVRGRADELLLVSIAGDSPADTETPIAIRLQDLVGGESIQTKISETSSWSLRRVEGDRLRVALIPKDRLAANSTKPVTELGTALFWDDQQAEIQVTADIEDATSLELMCDTFADGVQVVATQSWAVTIKNGRGILENPVWQPPAGDGSYELRWRLQRKSTSHSVMGVPFPNQISESISKPLTLIRGSSDSAVISVSKASIAVLARQPRTASESDTGEPLTVVGRIEPFGRSWSVSRLLPIRQATQLVSSSSTELKKTSIDQKQVAELGPGKEWHHTLPVAKVGQRHRMVLHLPAGQAMKLGVQITDSTSQDHSPRVIRDVTCIRTRTTEGSSKWVTAEVDYYPQSTSPQLILINRDSESPARFEAIDISLPSASIPPTNGSRALALAPAVRRTALMYLDSTQWLELFGGQVPSHGFGDKPRVNVLAAALRLVDVVGEQGYGGVLMSVCEDGQALYPSDALTPDLGGHQGMPCKLDGSPETLELLMRLFDRESLAFVPCIRPNFPATRLEDAIATGPAATMRGIAAANPWMGQSLNLRLNEVETYPGGLYNPTDDRVHRHAADLVGELATLCQSHACVRAIGVLADEGSYLQLPPPRATMDSTTLDRFHDSLPTNTILRSQLIGWIAEEGRTRFEAWRKQQLQALYSQMVSAIDEPTTKLMVISTTRQPPIELLDAASNRRLMFTRLYRRSYLDSLAAQCRDELATGMTASPTDSWKEESLPAALFIAPKSPLAPIVSDSIANTTSDRAGVASTTYPLPDAVTSSLSLAKLLSRGDRVFVAIDGNVSTGGNEVRRRSLTRFQALPAVLMEDIPPSDEAMKIVKLRRATHDGVTYFVATNHCRWPMMLQASLKNAADVEAVVASDAVPSIGADGSWRATMGPGELIAIRVLGQTASVSTWAAQLDDGAPQISEIGQMVRELADAIVEVTDPRPCDIIDNPGFEDVQLQASAASANSASTSSVTPAAISPRPLNVLGWLMAQHPEGCAAIDDEVVHEGKFSVRLRNLDGRPGATWMVSKAMDPPPSGRIAVSLMLRGEPSEKPEASEPLLVSVSIQGTIAGSLLRVSKQVEVPRDGRWSQVPCHLEVDSLPRCGVESLRLAIDVMSEGTVWIDSVKAYDVFMTESEKSHLQSQMFLALGGIAKGELSHAAKLLESHWVQYRLGLPLEPPHVVKSPLPETLDSGDESSDKRETEEIRPGIAERLKGWLPRPIRF